MRTRQPHALVFHREQKGLLRPLAQKPAASKSVLKGLCCSLLVKRHVAVWVNILT